MKHSRAWLCWLLCLAASGSAAEDADARFRALQVIPLSNPEQEREVLALLRDMPDNLAVFRLWQTGAESWNRPRFAGMIQRFIAEVMTGGSLADPPGEDGIETAEFRMLCDKGEVCETSACRAALLPELRRLLESEPHAPREAVVLAGMYRELGEHLPSAVLTYHALRCGNTNELLRLAYLQDLGALGLRQMELREWQRWTNPVQADPAQLRALVHRFMELGASSQAADWVSRWVRREPENGDAWLSSGRIAMANGNPDGAERDFAQALRTLPDPLPVWQELARLNARGRDVEQTRVWLRKIQPRLREEDWVNFLMEPDFSKVPEVMLGW